MNINEFYQKQHIPFIIVVLFLHNALGFQRKFIYILFNAKGIIFFKTPHVKKKIKKGDSIL